MHSTPYGKRLVAPRALCVVIILGVLLSMPAASRAATGGQQVYRSTCGTCHDSGAGQAPRTGAREEWLERFAAGRAALYAAAIGGVPATAMAPKGGFVELSDEQVKAAVDYMLERTGFVEPRVARAPARPPKPVLAPGAPRPDDVVIMARAAAALRDGLASASAPIEPFEAELVVRGVGIRVRALDGVVRLMGVVQDATVVKRAEAIVMAIPGVRAVENSLVAGGMLDFD
jgi:cytochrome c5